MTTDRRTVETYNAAATAYDAHVSDPADSPLHAYYEKPAMQAELPDLAGLYMNKYWLWEWRGRPMA